MNWTKEKPVLNRKCILLTATKLRDRFEIEGTIKNIGRKWK